MNFLQFCAAIDVQGGMPVSHFFQLLYHCVREPDHSYKKITALLVSILEITGEDLTRHIIKI